MYWGSGILSIFFVRLLVGMDSLFSVNWDLDCVCERF